MSIKLAWVMFLIALASLAIRYGPAAAIDYIAGAAVMAMASVVAFVVWSLLAWGFTLNMLLALERQRQFRGIDDWIRCYTGGGGVQRLSADRASVLLAAGFVIEAGQDGYRLTSLGRVAAALVAAGRWTFGIQETEWNRLP